LESQLPVVNLSFSTGLLGLLTGSFDKRSKVFTAGATAESQQHVRQLEAQLREAQRVNALSGELEQLKLQRESDIRRKCKAQVESLEEMLSEGSVKAGRLADRVKVLEAEKENLERQMNELERLGQEGMQELQELLKLEKEKSKVQGRAIVSVVALGICACLQRTRARFRLY
jgi:DNA repair exonuclease SbcCD ATPase subunit